MKVFYPHSVLGVKGRIGDNIFGPRRKAVSMKLDGTGVGRLPLKRFCAALWFCHVRQMITA